MSEHKSEAHTWNATFTAAACRKIPMPFNGMRGASARGKVGHDKVEIEKATENRKAKIENRKRENRKRKASPNVSDSRCEL